MDWDDPKAVEVFFEVHSMLPREGPGNQPSTARALALAETLPARPRVLDIACGPGQQTLDLAVLLPDATITAVDLHPPFVAEARSRAAAAGLDDRVNVIEGDMTALPFAPGSFDLLWCEGAAYIMGVEAALLAWKPLLAPGGRLACTEAVWLRDDPPEPVRRMWTEEYPAMTDIAANRALVRRCGYTLLGDFVLPQEAWFDDYYGPMAERIEVVAARHEGDPVAGAVLDEAREEIAVYRAFADCYGYLFIVLGL